MPTLRNHISKMQKGDIYAARGKGINNNPFNCDVGELGWLGNPVSIGKVCPICHQIHPDAGSTLPCYETYLVNKLKTNPSFNQAFYALKDKTLICFCQGECHTHVMIKYLDEMPKIASYL